MKDIDLPNEIETLKALVLNQQAIIEENAADIHRLTEKLSLAEALLYARRSEKKFSMNPHEGQCSLFGEVEAMPLEEVNENGEILEEESTEESTEEMPVEEAETIVIAGYVRVKKGRRPLPADFPREDVICDIPEENKICPCGCSLKKIGEEASEKLTIIPQTIRVIRTIRPKYACPSCEGVEDSDKTVTIAPMPPHIIPQGIATPSLLAYIALGKFAAALPLYRQSRILARIGVDISLHRIIRAPLCQDG